MLKEDTNLLEWNAFEKMGMSNMPRDYVRRAAERWFAKEQEDGFWHPDGQLVSLARRDWK
jgi:hypothetical protein